jgi:hypothetical protein
MNTMEKSCPGTETLAGWLEGSLTPQERSHVASHLAACDECRRAVAIASSTEPPPPQAVVNEILLARVVSASRRRNLRPLAAVSAILLAGAIALVARSTSSTAPTAVREAETPVAVLNGAKPVAVEVKPLERVAPPISPDPVKPTPAVVTPPETPKPVAVVPVPVKPAEPAPLPEAAPEPVAKVTAPAPASVDERALASVFVVDPVGDLWLRNERGEAKAGVLEKAAWKDLFAARTSGASFSLEARASVMLEKGSEAAFSHVKSDDSYSVALGQGLVMLDTEGSTQRWRISFGKSELDFNDFNGRLAVESRGDRMSALLLDGKAEMKIGALAKKAQVGQELVLSREGQVVEQKVETQKKLARLDELRPKVFTAFAATFDEKKEEFQPYPYTVVSGRVASGPAGFYLQSEGPPSPKVGEKIPVVAEVRPERSFGVISGMVLRFRYRTTLPVFTVKIGKYSADFVSRKAGQWADAEIPLRELSFEGTPMLPTDPVESVRFTAFFEKRVGQLDIDGVQFLRRVR